ncbi:MAG: CNNM domain-containing protein [Saccharospirillum sp.]|nr:CNNM domain-containing protein [Saccharospirillum sp.]
MTILTWFGILLCLSQSALLSGMNLGLFSLSKLELEVAARKGDAQAKTVLALRQDANFALVTILWGNVGVNVFLALLSNSILNGVLAFLFSTVVITVFAEIMPQAYFSRNALRMAALLSPVLRGYQLVLYPLAKPTAKVLDWWLGAEGIRFYREKDLRRIIRLHMDDAESDIARMEGQGALNFLEIDDVPMREEGEPVDPKSVLTLPFLEGKPQFPTIEPSTDDAFLRVINRSGKSWVVIVDTEGEPRLVLSANDFIRQALFAPDQFNPFKHCHRPIIVRNPQQTLGELMQRYRVRSPHQGDDIVEEDVILLWGETPKVVTGTDILGRLLRGIAREGKAPAPGSSV